MTGLIAHIEDRFGKNRHWHLSKDVTVRWTFLDEKGHLPYKYKYFPFIKIICGQQSTITRVVHIWYWWCISLEISYYISCKLLGYGSPPLLEISFQIAFEIAHIQIQMKIFYKNVYLVCYNQQALARVWIDNSFVDNFNSVRTLQFSFSNNMQHFHMIIRSYHEIFKYGSNSVEIRN